MQRFLYALAGATLLLGTFASAQTPAPTPAPNPCAGAAFHQFDFWAGNWTVHNHSDNKFAGTNNVTREFGGCVLQEHWKGTGGSEGSSFSLYDATRKVWHQTWVDNAGTLLLLEGGFKNGMMTMSGPGFGQSGRPIVNRITWTPAADGSVRQVWDVRYRSKSTWRTVFDGVYRKT